MTLLYYHHQSSSSTVLRSYPHLLCVSGEDLPEIAPPPPHSLTLHTPPTRATTRSPVNHNLFTEDPVLSFPPYVEVGHVAPRYDSKVLRYTRV